MLWLEQILDENSYTYVKIVVCLNKIVVARSNLFYYFIHTDSTLIHKNFDFSSDFPIG